MNTPQKNLLRIEDHILKTAQRQLEYPAISAWHNGTWTKITYDDLVIGARAYQALLQDLKIKQGERIIVFGRNNITTIQAILGTWIHRATVVLIDIDLPQEEVKFQCDTADARLILAPNDVNPDILALLSDRYAFVPTKDLGLMCYLCQPSATNFKDCDASIATLLFTSGTTGESKAVMLTHQSFSYLMEKFQHYDLGGVGDRSLTILPLFHVAGLLCGILQPLYLGAEIIIFSQFSIEALQDAFVNKNPTVVVGVPRLLEALDHKILLTVNEKGNLAKFIFHFLLFVSYISGRFFGYPIGKLFFKKIHKQLGGQLNKILCGSARLSPAIQKRFLSYGFEMLFSYGLTETCGPITFTKAKYLWRLSSVGPCVDINDLKITGSGEICYGGPALMMGYFRDKEITNLAIKSGWFHTRDLGYLDKDNNLYVNGRKKELIVFNDGKKAMPEQIERQYRSIIGIKDLAIIDHEQDGRVVILLAFVPDEGFNPEMIRLRILERASSLKSPYRVAQAFEISEIPRSNTLKVKRHLLKEHLSDKLNTKTMSANSHPVDNDRLVHVLIECFLNVIPKKSNKITPHVYFSELEIDSLMAATLCVEINKRLNLQLQPTAFWFSHNITSLAAYIEKHYSASKKNTSGNSCSEKIAIIEMVGQFPGDAHNIQAYWENLKNGKNAIIEVPKQRWDNDVYFDPYPLEPGKINTKYGGFIQLPDNFDPSIFEIKSRVAKQMDPQQKILLMETEKLLKQYDQRKDIKDWYGENVACYIGSGFQDFMTERSKNVSINKINAFTGIGMSEFSLAGRIAYHFGLSGPAMVIKTACSSSLVSVHQAVLALQHHDCDLAIAGGINIMLSPDPSICLSKAGFLSADGYCKTFDERANGYVRSEGVGLILLKRYEDAKRDGDKILATIIGSAINQDGASNGITAPNGQAQMACYESALTRAGIDPNQVKYLEAHGTGTQLGDAIEMSSIQSVYDQNRADDNPIYVGAVKSQIGHCESAAGIAGLIKTTLILQHQKIPPNLHFKTPNSHINFHSTQVHLPKKVISFEKKGIQYCAVSSFGIAGTNAHLILERA